MYNIGMTVICVAVMTKEKLTAEGRCVRFSLQRKLHSPLTAGGLSFIRTWDTYSWVLDNVIKEARDKGNRPTYLYTE